MYEAVLLTFSIGFLTKFVDLIVDDGLKIPKTIAYLIGMFYGILIAYVMVTYPVLAPLGFAVILAVIMTRKIDKNPHVAGIGVMVVLLIVWGIPLVDVGLLFLFLVAGGLDEIVSDLADKGKLKGIVGSVFGKRIILDAVAFIFSLITWQWIVFFAMISFDVAYQLTERFGKRFAGLNI